MKTLTVADLFCGAGGSSTGARLALEARGLGMKLVAINHWATAIATHSKNHPEAVHVIDKLENVRPRDLVRGRLDILIASPECTDHSRARGGKPINDQRRMSAWQVTRWISDVRPRAILVENVPEFQEWGPLDAKGEKPLKSRRGETFKAWLESIRAQGYRAEARVLRCADYGDATTRERLFVLAVEDRKQIRWPDPTHSPSGERDLFGCGAKRWRSAAECIDWELEGTSIFNRKKLLSPNTNLRIYAGAVRFRWPEVFVIAVHELLRHQRVPLSEINDVARRARAVPARSDAFLMRSENLGGNGLYVRSIDEPPYTVTTNGGLALAQPVVMQGNQGKGRTRNMRGVHDAPLQTVLTRESLALARPFLLSQASGGAAREDGEPVPAIPTRGAHALVVPYHRTGVAKSVREPLPTATTRDRFGLAFIAAAFGERKGQLPRTHSVEAPAPTLCAKGRIQLVRAFVKQHGIDVKYRMLQPPELARSMSFPDTYAWEGNKTEVTAQIGNAVPVYTALALVDALVGAIL